MSIVLNLKFYLEQIPWLIYDESFLGWTGYLKKKIKSGETFKISKYYSQRFICNALEENPEYHKIVLDTIDNEIYILYNTLERELSS